MTPIIPVELYKLGFEAEAEGWHNAEHTFFIYMIENGFYQQYQDFSANIIGIPLTTMEELQIRYKSITGKTLEQVKIAPPKAI